MRLWDRGQKFVTTVTLSFNEIFKKGVLKWKEQKKTKWV